MVGAWFEREPRSVVGPAHCRRRQTDCARRVGCEPANRGRSSADDLRAGRRARGDRRAGQDGKRRSWVAIGPPRVCVGSAGHSLTHRCRGITVSRDHRLADGRSRCATTARHTSLAASPWARAASTVRPASSDRTVSAAQERAYAAPKCSSIRRQNSVSRTARGYPHRRGTVCRPAVRHNPPSSAGRSESEVREKIPNMSTDPLDTFTPPAGG